MNKGPVSSKVEECMNFALFKIKRTEFNIIVTPEFIELLFKAGCL